MAKEGTPSSLRLTGAFKKMIELLMRERVFNDRTAYIEQMVRDDWDKRATPQMQAELTAFLAKEEQALALNERPVKPLPPTERPTRYTKQPEPPMPTIPEWALIHTDSIVLTDREGLVLWINDAFTALCGYDLKTLRGHKPGQFVQRGDAEQPAVLAMRSAIARGKFATVEITNYHRDGTPYKALIVLGPLKQKGHITHFAAVERVAGPGVEAELRATLDRFLGDITHGLTAHSAQRQPSSKAAHERQSLARAAGGKASDELRARERKPPIDAPSGGKR